MFFVKSSVLIGLLGLPHLFEGIEEAQRKPSTCGSTRKLKIGTLNLTYANFVL